MKATLSASKQERAWISLVTQFARFSLVGGANTLVDILAFNLLLWLLPTQNSGMLTVYNSLAFLVGAVNSFVWNRRWTFEAHSPISRKQALHFLLITGLGILFNDLFLSLATQALFSLSLQGILWTNLAKVSAIAGSFLVSYLGMRFVVFARSQQNSTPALTPPPNNPHLFIQPRSLSVILPAYNEEEVIAETLSMITSALNTWKCDFELLVVNDGSKDRTEEIVNEQSTTDTRIHLINHPVNRGYGAALVTGFEAANKETVFFMDADGQFDIQDLVRFFPLIEEYDAVLGYRVQRQDAWMRKLNAWCWKQLVRFVFGVHAKDIDCAFKLYRTDFFRTQRLETRGAMINTEILYKLARSGRTTIEVGVRHLPRRGGKATGAKISVIIRALRELFIYAHKWYAYEL